MPPKLSQPSGGQGPVASLSEYIRWDFLSDPSLSREFVLRCLATTPRQRVLQIFRTIQSGLCSDTADKRRECAGPNVLTVCKPPSWPRMLFLSFMSPFNALLIVLAILSVATPGREWANFGVLMAMVAFSVALRFTQDYKNNRITAALQAEFATTQANIHRPTGTQSIGSELLVPGDIVVLGQGDTVPADCYLLNTNRLMVSQSSLTGESNPEYKTDKITTTEVAAKGSPFDLPNIAFRGTSIVSGHGTAVVVGTGDRSLIATVTEELTKTKPTSAFDKGIRSFSFLMIGLMTAMVAVVFAIRGKHSGDWAQAAEFSLAVAVGIVPEMLPAIINSNLAVGAQKLAKRGAIVKTIHAVQNLGSIRVLCSDKTGTLTEDNVNLHRFENVKGNESNQVLSLAVSEAGCHDNKNCIDVAITKAAISEEKMVIGTKLGVIPFQFEARFSGAILKTDDGETKLIVKGAFEEVLNMCQFAQEEDSNISTPLLSGRRKESIFQRAYQYNDSGYRVLAVASSLIDSSKVEGILSEALGVDIAAGLVFEGLLAFSDPLRSDAAAAINDLQSLGVEAKVLTGDNARVAMKICRDLNIVCGDLESGIQAITGPELAELSDEAFHKTVKNTTIFAKLTPKQKGDIVLSLKSQGYSVGMLGDGINDCIALRFADVGISVDNGAAVAKSCADVILTDKKLSIICEAIRTGRITHGNAIKYIYMVVSANFGNALSILLASIWLPYQPMTSLQILVQNLLYDMTQLALPWDKVDEEYMLKPQSWCWQRLLWFVVVFGPLSTAADMGILCLNWFHYNIRKAYHPLISLAQTNWFVSGLVTQVVIIFVLRTGKVPFLQSTASLGLLAVTVAVLSLGIALAFALQPPNFMGTTPPDEVFAGVLVVAVLGYCVSVQCVKWAWKRVTGGQWM